MNRPSYVVALGSVFCIGAAIAVAGLSERARVGFSWSQVPCYGRLLARAEGSADLVFLGSSRILMGIDAGTVARGHGLSPDRAFNLAHNDRSYLADRLLLQSVSARHQPKIVIMEAYVPSRRLYDLERPSATQAETRKAAAPTIDRLALAFGAIGDLPVDGQDVVARAHGNAVILARKIEQFAAFTLTGRLLAAQWPSWRRFARDANVCRPRRNIRRATDVDIRTRYLVTFRPESPDRWQSWPRDRPELLTDPVSDPIRTELIRTAELARARSIRLAYLYLPSKFIPPPTEHFTQSFAAVIGAPLLVPPPRLLERLQRDGYTDEAHLNARGRGLISAWLAHTKLIDAD